MKENINLKHKNIFIKNWSIIILITLFSLFPLTGNNYFIDVAFFFGIYALLGLSLNVVLGEVGLFDLGHMGFMAIGAYTTAILNTNFSIPIIIANKWFGSSRICLPGLLPNYTSTGRLFMYCNYWNG